jgi:hypothetical protein
MNNSISMLIENWQMIVSLMTILGVGYVTVRKFERILGKDEKGRTIADRLDRVENQLFPNGGSSIPDRVRCLSDNQEELKSDIKSLSVESKIIYDVLMAYIKDGK